LSIIPFLDTLKREARILAYDCDLIRDTGLD
jgi:hypothetical protein